MGIRRYLLKRNVITIGIIITGILSILAMLLAFYGSYSGNFIITLDNKDVFSSISLVEEKDSNLTSPRLYADSVSDLPDLSFDELKLLEAVEADGNYFDPEFKYFAYSFYLVNNGLETVNIEMEYRITEVHRQTDEMIRIIIIKNDDIENLSADNLKMYKKADKVPHEYNPAHPVAEQFVDDKTVFKSEIEAFAPEQRIKFTVIIYIEGEDPDSTDDKYGGQIKMSLRFSIIEDEEEE